MAIAELTDHYGEQEVLVPHRTEHPKVFWSNYAYYPHTIFKKEPQTAFLKRVHAFYNRLPIRSIIITHGSIVQTIAKLAVGEVVDAVPVWDHSIPNASVTRIKDGKVIWNATKDFDKL
jgi:broad specificity phosphatase PhoE